MKVLVTGGCGFMGSHVCQLFKERGWDVVAYDNLSKTELWRTGYSADIARAYMVAFLEDIGVPLVVGDIRDIADLGYAAMDCDYIINCAAQPAMTIALENPEMDCGVNVAGTLNCLTLGKNLGIPVALCSTIHVYGNGINAELTEHADRFRRWIPAIDEDYPVLSGKITPLHVSKYASELYARAYVESYGSKVATFRLTGLYGERQFGGEDHGWVANFAIKTLTDQPMKIYGSDKQVRDILYVKDAAQAFLDWFECGQPSGVYNIGGGERCIISIRQVLAQLCGLTGREQRITREPSRKGDLWYFVADFSKSQRAFGWQPSMMPVEGLYRLVKWVEENQEIFQTRVPA